MIDNMQHYLKNKRNVFTQVMQQLDDYSPLKTLERGFVYSTNEHGETISSVKQVQKMIVCYCILKMDKLMR